MKKINPNKKWFSSKKEATEACNQHSNLSVRVYKQKEGKHKGQYFVGNYMDFINRY